MMWKLLQSCWIIMITNIPIRLSRYKDILSVRHWMNFFKEFLSEFFLWLVLKPTSKITIIRDIVGGLFWF